MSLGMMQAIETLQPPRNLILSPLGSVCVCVCVAGVAGGCKAAIPIPPFPSPASQCIFPCPGQDFFFFLISIYNFPGAILGSA